MLSPPALIPARCRRASAAGAERLVSPGSGEKGDYQSPTTLLRPLKNPSEIYIFLYISRFYSMSCLVLPCNLQVKLSIDMIIRDLENKILYALNARSVFVLTGPRKVGKTTLATQNNATSLKLDSAYDWWQIYCDLSEIK